ncbi:glutaredoxin 3 [[Limnothrix rosea] IAM M-220]|uniref:glutaredoxin 3 n=1 Tax=[Limnothrix rosea] IAM M-220 TaxID=454133 RepID=UPI0009655790|nr:glutaredoxin 3 [[Limnothrix rosea] IAM M-220]OKH19345.1 glutaredoxin 3 [[Limnothrix rosea] IAM M-220]
MAAKIEIYTWSACPFCIRAKRLLDSKGVDYTEYCIDGDHEAREAMTDRANGSSSLPQIFIDDQHIGGCDDIHALDRQGELEPMLSQAA